MSEPGPTSMRCVTSRVRPVRRWPPRAVIAADGTSRCGASSVWWGLGNKIIMANYGKWKTYVCSACYYAGEYHCGIRRIKLCFIHQVK